MLCSIPEFKNDFCIHVNGDANFDKHVHEPCEEGFLKTAAD